MTDPLRKNSNWLLLMFWLFVVVKLSARINSSRTLLQADDDDDILVLMDWNAWSKRTLEVYLQISPCD